VAFVDRVDFVGYTKPVIRTT